MHEVKVYDNSGNLKKVISVKALNIRSQKQLDSPALFKKDKRIQGAWTKSRKDQSKPKSSLT